MKNKLLQLSLYAVILILGMAMLGAVFGPVAYWSNMTETPLNVWIVDKTVPTTDYREHKGLVWVLNHNKITNQATNEHFQNDRDYYGFIPVNREVYKVKNVSDAKRDPDLIYLTDTYGVYTDDYLKQNLSGTRSDLIYGGLTKEELGVLKSNLGNGNTIIGEFNIASAPTNSENREELGAVFGVEWTGWKARYFKELARDVEVPALLIDNYEKQQNVKWAFTGEGYVLVSDYDEIVVLQAAKDVGENGLRLVFNEPYASEFKVKKEIPYQYWFEFVVMKRGREAVANYKLDLTDEGRKTLAELGLPAEFPAIIRNDNTQYTAYYFAGDFADIKNTNGLWKYYGFEKIKKITSAFNKNTPDYFYWNCYVPLMNKIIDDIKHKTNMNPEYTAYDPQQVNLYSKTVENGFQVLKNGKWEDFFVKGVNIGAALPGKWFTEFPKDESVYLSWFEKIGEMNANSIRIYTLLPPEFYSALKYYNESHPGEMLYLLQEIWPEENPIEHDYLRNAYIQAYYKEIEHVIDAVHGTANIPERQGRAYGIYTSDVSEYVLGYLVGRELEPDEVIATNQNNEGFGYKGEYISAEKDASPSEAWLAMNCDYVMKYESNKYRTQHPVAIVSWPTLDVQEHSSEWNASGLKLMEYNDKVSIDINNISLEDKMQAGLFGAYHIYPNYPDFMNNESKYDEYSDEEGRFRYGGYLEEFIEGHTKYPALVAEFGLATGMGNAHTSPDGYNHGALTEEQQGNGVVRMMKAIQREGYAGGVIFEWMDEWAKKTWITEPYMIPYDRHVLWHNAIDPEQNYGIMAMEPQWTEREVYVETGGDVIKQIRLTHDEAFLYLDISLDQALDFNTEKLLIGLDTYDRGRGDFKLDKDTETVSPTGLEFLLDFSGPQSGKILVHPGYNISQNKFSSYASNKGIFEEIKPLINSKRVTQSGRKINAIYQDGSKLNFGYFESDSSSHWYIDNKTLHIRIPWGRLNFADPSSLKVLDDDRKMTELARDQLKTANTEGVMVSALVVDVKNEEKVDMLSTKAPYKWQSWDVPKYQERLKKSYFIIQDYFKKL